MIEVQRVGSYAFITAEGHVLLSLLNRGPNRGKWTLVGGGVEFKEDPKAALIREIEEEAGIRIDVEPKLIDVFSHDYAFDLPDGSKKHMHFIGIIHQIELPEKISCKETGDGFSSDGTRWFPISSLNLEELNPSVIKVLKKLGYLDR
jgi:8-oxo-dGTP pyrophosphatase MutT (NUDIX family)